MVKIHYSSNEYCDYNPIGYSNKHSFWYCF